MRRCIAAGLAVATLAFAGHGQAQALQTGTYTLKATAGEIINGDPAYAGLLPADTQEEWVVHVPPAYSPKSPPGILVYISPTAAADVPPHWDTAIDDTNLIWISAAHSGNDVLLSRRVADALVGLKAVEDRYAHDARRVYIAGFSGGGRAASRVMSNLPGIFTGAIYICGGDSWPDGAAVERMTRARYVFMTGPDDFNRSEVRSLYGAYLKAGMTQAKLMDLVYLGHDLPAASDLGAAIAFLDGGTP